MKFTKPRNKYRAIKTTIGAETFDSKAEARRWVDLQLMLRAGAIVKLERQVSYDLVVNGQKVCVYYSDFRYERAGQVVVEDVKGMRTPVYNLKRKLMRAIHGIEIVEIGRKPRKARRRKITLAQGSVR